MIYAKESVMYMYICTCTCVHVCSQTEAMYKTIVTLYMYIFSTHIPNTCFACICTCIFFLIHLCISVLTSILHFSSLSLPH